MACHENSGSGSKNKRSELANRLKSKLACGNLECIGPRCRYTGTVCNYPVAVQGQEVNKYY